MKRILNFILFVILLVSAVFVIRYYSDKKLPVEQVKDEIGQEEIKNTENFETLIVAQNLEIPWSLAFLPDGSLLFTERPGRVRMIDRKGVLLSSPLLTLSQVKHIGEGGLLGMAIHPNFEKELYVYLYYTYSSTGNNTLNRVSRFKFAENQLAGEEIIVDAIPGALNHNGGRIRFGPDKLLYITTGDAQDPSLAQNTNSLAGKILRATDKGEKVQGNPFDNLVYSFGHRNPQGLAWDDKAQLWSSEHGRSGVASGLDEINLIKIGGNYGWPEIQGGEEKAGMEKPLLHSGDDTWAPASLAFINGSLFFGGLRGQALYEVFIEGDKINFKEHFKGELGRIRDVVLGPDGFLYITTSNRDGRGAPSQDDDKIIKIDWRNLNSL